MRIGIVGAGHRPAVRASRQAPSPYAHVHVIEQNAAVRRSASGVFSHGALEFLAAMSRDARDAAAT